MTDTTTTPEEQPDETMEEHRRDWLKNIKPSPTTLKAAAPSESVPVKVNPLYQLHNMQFFEIYMGLVNKTLSPTKEVYDMLVRKGRLYPEGHMKKKVRDSIPTLFATLLKMD